ncbi:bifunctional hydroxymethylpyrimidine kinase/phosphomethylpyrimidine kinase [Arthrobacter sp. UM1]|uniref:bifunctional hydroxymethylpyrimidine kinase/phosphomethylpyrimidine kinase n=1 Tax=Arthrobacter sp. UM1 TaxID=2766776 RepID=UPI001CF6D746|nr:bifunctional hydroxymethylpyrimidine kinase/phosphomethylpyrimidine kinase [Arthrobacter sp. UM1]MCB4207792.1 bifunctional hydroxymethylpyrimidine kinase/phosphomethylpyrimidine kinase [Arthrobacter sp. UM1]
MSANTDRQVPRVLSIAGTDPTGGAGLHADLKSIAAFGGYGMGAVTAVVAQNTTGVQSVHPLPLETVRAQLESVSDDVQIDAVKIGMLGGSGVVETVRAWLEEVRPPNVVLDPVMVASSGDRLLDADAEASVRELVRLADLVTPNIPELAVLLEEEPAEAWATARRQAERLAVEWDVAVLLKGGHLDGETAPDAVVTRDGIAERESDRIRTRNTHGTGCSLSSAMATAAAWGLTWEEALDSAKDWLGGAIAAADALRVGHGHGPVDHGHHVRDAVVEQLGLARAWTVRQWEASADVRRVAEQSPFVAALAEGTLERARFDWYLEQDLLYLRDYARVLARAAQLAPTSEEQVFWARASAGCLEEEAQLHEASVSAEGVRAAETTLAYTQHLEACTASGSYAVVVAAVLPCFWLYQDVGERLGRAASPGHPYEDWLSAYGADEFRELTLRAIEITEGAAQAVSPAERERMAWAFQRSMEKEREFFEAPWTADLETGPAR